jgi:hypothetical protein
MGTHSREAAKADGSRADCCRRFAAYGILALKSLGLRPRLHATVASRLLSSATSKSASKDFPLFLCGRARLVFGPSKTMNRLLFAAVRLLVATLAGRKTQSAARASKSLSRTERVTS